MATGGHLEALVGHLEALVGHLGALVGHLGGLIGHVGCGLSDHASEDSWLVLRVSVVSAELIATR